MALHLSASWSFDGPHLQCEVHGEITQRDIITLNMRDEDIRVCLLCLGALIRANLKEPQLISNQE